MVSCPEVEDLEELARGGLSEEAATRVRAHLAECDRCRRRQAEAAALRRILAELPEPPAPADLAEGMLRRVRLVRRRQRLRRLTLLAGLVILYGAAQGELDPLWLPAFLSRVSFDFVWVVGRLVSQLPLLQGIVMAFLAVGVVGSGVLLGRTLSDPS